MSTLKVRPVCAAVTLHLSARWKAALGAIGVTGNLGGRLVKVDRTLEGNRRIGDVVTRISEDSDETNFLPNLSAVVSWTDRLQSHLSVGYALTPNLTLNFDTINLTMEQYESYPGDPIRPCDIRYTPTIDGLSLRYQM